MKKSFCILYFLILNIFLFGQTIELPDIVADKYAPKTIQPFVSSTDGNFYYQTDKENTQLLKYSFESGLCVDTLLDLHHLSNNLGVDKFDGFEVDPTEHRVLIYTETEKIYRHSFKAEYYIYDIEAKVLQKLSLQSQKQMIPLFANDGNQLAYVVDNNIYLYNFKDGTTTQITDDGQINSIINGATDWAYEEEFATTSLMSFSPDNKFLAFVRFDETDVNEFSFQVYKDQLYPKSVKFKYPKSGEKNSIVNTYVYNIDTKNKTKIKLDSQNIEYIPKIEFTSNEALSISTLNRHQNDFKLFSYDILKNKSRLFFEDKNEYYINYEFINSIFFFDDSFTYIAEKDGFSHIYLYSMNGDLIQQLTKGNYDITSILSVNPKTKTLFYQSADNSPKERSIHKIELTNSGIKDIKISRKAGFNSAQFSQNGKYYINNWSDINTPNIIAVFDEYGKQLRILENNNLLSENLSKKIFPKKEFIVVEGADGNSLNGWILKPSDFDRNKKYPLLMIQYSGPDSQQVLNRFNIDWIDYLVTKGYIVACIDGRGTGARGEKFRKCTYQNLGIKESDDQIAAAKHLGKLPYVDSSDISIWGWSFSGYNVLMCLSRSEGVFKKGIAIAPVTDWRFYDSVYTERYMRTPQENKIGYDNGSPIKLATNLSGELLLIHGSADDNVHFQNSMEYITALISEKKSFEMFVFPDLNHSIPGVKNRLYLYDKIISFLTKK